MMWKKGSDHVRHLLDSLEYEIDFSQQFLFQKRAIYTNDSYSSNNVGDIVPAEGTEGKGNHWPYRRRL